ncbi:MAG: multicopper oxidase domain-containing protein [Chloroflexi bacterium]|nr:multicopper oxidase domain-containing protein [Chloroflexota bacterium]
MKTGLDRCQLSRRDFLKYSVGGLAAIVVGSKLGWLMQTPAYAAVQTHTIELEIGDAIKQMVTHNSIHNAECYFWVYKCAQPVINPNAEVPGPTIFATQGDTVNITVTNLLDEPHAFFIPGVVASGPIPPVQNAPNNVWTKSFKVPATVSGALLYYDNLNEPVNRMMGLHGAFIIMPDFTAPPPGGAGNKWTPYHNPTANVQALFNAFGNPDIWPGLAWGEGGDNPAPHPPTPAFRTYIWLDHQASPNLFAEVGNFTPGEDYPAAQFVDIFLNSPFDATNSSNFKGAQYFTVNGQSGHFSHNNPHITPMLKVGEPCVVHILNAGLWMHSMHLHANHFYVTSINGMVQTNPLWLDVFNIHPLDRVDYVIPYMRPPDVPNARGIGRPDTVLQSPGNALIPGSVPHPVWPPSEELDFSIPSKIGVTIPGVGGLTALDAAGNAIDLGVQLSPLCYPMHDHSEPSQTAQGGNYNLGLIAGMNITGDRNLPGGVTEFPNDPDHVPPNTARASAEPHSM